MTLYFKRTSVNGSIFSDLLTILENAYQ